MPKIGTCSRRCKGRKRRAFASCLRTCMKKGGTKRRRRRRRRR